MVQLLRNDNDNKVMQFNVDFQRDLNWFRKFLSKHNELAASLAGPGATWNNNIYRLSIQRYCNNLRIIAHLEMLNILLAIQVFAVFAAFRSHPCLPIQHIQRCDPGMSDCMCLVYLFICCFFLSLSTQYRSYHNGQLEGQRKPVYTVGQDSVL